MDIQNLERLAREALHEADLAYQFNPSSYTCGAHSAIENLLKELRSSLRDTDDEEEGVRTVHTP